MVKIQRLFAKTNLKIPVLLTKKKMFIEVEREMARYDIIAGKTKSTVGQLQI